MTQVGEGSAGNDKEAKEEQPPEIKKEPIELRLSVFFDGTGNNRGNIQARKDGDAAYTEIKKQNSGEDEQTNYASFDSDFSNISILEEQFKSTTECALYHSIYVEGIGTRDLKTVNKEYEDKAKAVAEKNRNLSGRNKIAEPKMATDSGLGYAAALSDTGLYAKADRAYERIDSWLQDLLLDQHIIPEDMFISKFVVDVHGFSRGAATARYFIHRLLVGSRRVVTTMRNVGSHVAPVKMRTVYRETLLSRVKTLDIDIDDNAIEIGFVGLFDTVSSFGLAITSDVKTLHLDWIKKARKVYHLTAAEEHRLCFSLTNIKSAGSKGEEYFLPGVHSDIGGGYREFGAEVETFDLLNNDRRTIALYNLVNQGGRVIDYDAFQQLMEAEGWYQGKDEIWIEHQEGWIRDRLALKTHRSKIDNAYRLIPLQLMVEMMEKHDFVFKGDIKKNYQVPAELKTIESRIRSYIGSVSNSKPEDWFTKIDPELKELRHKYLHCSARVKLGHWPRFKKQKRYRQEYDG